MHKFFFVYGLLTAGGTMAIAIFCYSWLEKDQAATFAWVVFTGAVTGWSAFVGSIIHPQRPGETRLRIIELFFISVGHLGVGMGWLFLALQIVDANGISKGVLTTSIVAAALFYFTSGYSIFRVWFRQLSNCQSNQSN